MLKDIKRWDEGQQQQGSLLQGLFHWGHRLSSLVLGSGLWGQPTYLHPTFGALACQRTLLLSGRSCRNEPAQALHALDIHEPQEPQGFTGLGKFSI